ncbi:NrdR family transcriptional regulator [Brevibacillus reuszeri]|uniref:NrdR family transcriptional regulator n=1 Tax=Brevibacillus reuszeri TaxID=54915 RepID=UPI00358EBE98
MICPNCESRSSTVKDKRLVSPQKVVTRRRRECNECKTRWTTHEVLAGNIDIPEQSRRSGEKET